MWILGAIDWIICQEEEEAEEEDDEVEFEFRFLSWQSNRTANKHSITNFKYG